MVMAAILPFTWGLLRDSDPHRFSGYRLYEIAWPLEKETLSAHGHPG